MSIQVSCDCAMTYRLPDRYAGKRCRCRECGESIRVPRREAREDVAVEERPREAKARAKAKPAAAKPARASGTSARKRILARAGRGEGPISESLHQIAPLPLSEGRSIEPARAARVARVGLLARKLGPKPETRRGRDRDREDDDSREERALKKKRRDREDDDSREERALKKKKRRERDEDDEESDDERPRKKSPKAAKRGGGGRDEKGSGGKGRGKDEKRDTKRRGRSSREDDDEGGDDDEGQEAEERGRPRKKSKAQQQLILFGSVGFMIVCILFLVGVKVSKDNAEAAKIKHHKDVLAKITSAREIKDQKMWNDARTAYKDASAFAFKEGSPEITDPEVQEAIKKAKVELKAVEDVIAAQALPPADGVLRFIELVNNQDPNVREVGVRLCGLTFGVAATPPIAEVAGKCGDPSPDVARAAREAMKRALEKLEGTNLEQAIFVTLNGIDDKAVLELALQKTQTLAEPARFEKQLGRLTVDKRPEIADLAKKILQTPPPKPKKEEKKKDEPKEEKPAEEKKDE